MYSPKEVRRIQALISESRVMGSGGAKRNGTTSLAAMEGVTTITLKRMAQKIKSFIVVTRGRAVSVREGRIPMQDEVTVMAWCFVL